MDMTGEAEGEPQLAGIYLPDIGTANHAYGEIMKALFRRATTGEGSRIDVSMLQSTASWLLQPITMYKTFGKVMHRRGNTISSSCLQASSPLPTAGSTWPWATICSGGDDRAPRV